MKKLLLGGTAIAGALVATGLTATSAAAEDGIKLAVGGYFKEAYMVVIDDDEELELGNERNTDGFFNDAEIHFTGSTVLDNGLEVGARVELEGETNGDQVDEAWVFFSGGWGELRIGSEDEALANACVVPPGGTANFSAFSPNQWGANGSSIAGFPFLDAPSSNSVCTGVDDFGDAQKILYISPIFGGFQLTASYTPSAQHETHTDGAGPHLGMPAHFTSTLGNSRHNVSAYATYVYQAEDWGVLAGLGGSWEGHVEEGENGDATSFGEEDFYQAGIDLSLGNFVVGIVGEYYNDVVSVNGPDGNFVDADIWVAGIGASYAMDAWTFGVQYSHRESDTTFTTGGDTVDIDSQQDRAVATVNYALGPGINIDGEVGYTWIDLDPEAEEAAPFLPDGLDDYDGLEFGIGVAMTF